MATGTVAGALGVAPATVQKYARDGRIPYDVTAGGHRRFSLAEVHVALGLPAKSSGKGSADPERHAALTWTPPADIDPEVIALCRAVNLLPGLATAGSCCGHRERPFRIWVIADDLAALPPLAYYLACCHTGLGGWQLIAGTDCAMSPVVFEIEGPSGAYEAADQIAALITGYAGDAQ